MNFFTFSSEPRPIRLSHATRVFAHESLHHKYGKMTRDVPCVTLDHIPDFEKLTPYQKYNACIREIALHAPLRICEGERLSGAATLGMSIEHLVPVTYRGATVFGSVSHLTIDFATVLKIGINGIEQQVYDRLSKPTDPKQREFLDSCLSCIESFRILHGRYLDALSKMPEYAENYGNLCHVPFAPANSFYEAVQSIWFTFAFVRLCGNWPGIGRLDQMLGDYLKHDLQSGSITSEQAREILAHFFIKGCEWVAGGNYGSGDAQHYQNIVLAGIDADGNEVTNEVTYLILDVLEELNIGDFPTTLRLHADSPDRLLRRIAEVMKHGGGVLAIYAEDTVIEAMIKAGYSLREARSFANDGCWEMQVPGRTNFTYRPFDGLQILLKDTLHLDGEPAYFDNIQMLKNAYFTALSKKIDEIYADYFSPDGAFIGIEDIPTTVIGLFENGCIQNAKDYLYGGTQYLVRSPHIGGAADVGNSLWAIQKLCFVDKLIPFDDLMRLLQHNWEDGELLRQYALHQIPYYGNDEDEADRYTVEVVNTFAKLVHGHRTAENCFFVPGVSTFGRQIEWREERFAVPHGHKRGDILAPNMAATPGSDMAGATALIRSYCKLDLSMQTTGAALDLKLLPSSVRGENGTNALVGLLRGFVALGGCFLQPDIIDNSILKDAQLHPENYTSLCVRISGWNARFVTLDKEWQDMCIEKSTHGEI